MRLSIRLKVMVPLVVGLVLIAVATALLMGFVHRHSVDQAALADLRRSAASLSGLEQVEVDRLSALLDVIAAERPIAAAFLRRDRGALLALSAPVLGRLRDQRGVGRWYFHPLDPAGGVFLRVHHPERFGDRVHREVLARAAASGRTESAIELGASSYAVRVVRPWRVDGALIGYLELATDVWVFLSRIEEITGDRYGLLLAKRTLDRAAWGRATGHPDAWGERSELVAVTGATDAARWLGGFDRVDQIPAEPAMIEWVHDGGRTMTRGIFPLRGAAGDLVGGMVVLHDITPLLAGLDELRGQVVVLVVLLATALAALVIFLFDAIVLEPIARMSRVLERLPDRLARGEYGPELGLERPADDEIGRFEGFLAQAIARVGSFVAEVRRQNPGERHRGRELDRW